MNGMEQSERLADAVHRGLGRAGRILGQWCAVYRPDGPSDPLRARNLILRLPAAFARPDGSFRRAAGWGDVLWRGVFDAAYTRPGDFLVQGGADVRVGHESAIWFIVAQQRLMPVLCARTTARVRFSRPAVQEWPGAAPYGGRDRPDDALLSNWPATVVAAGGTGAGDAGLPDDTRGVSWMVLLPAVSGVTLMAGDRMEDARGRNGIVAAAEQSDLGWRLRVRETAT